MRVMITGAAGFIGQHVVKALLDAGHEPIGLDVRPCSDQYVTNHRVAWITVNIGASLEPIPNLDAVIHLAGIAAPNECDKDPTRAFDINVNGTNQVLKMALASGARKVVFASTGHVYGISPKYMPTDESHPLWLQNTYTLTKILGEQLCQLYYQNHGLSYIALRLYNAYGPGQRTGYFIPDMIAKAKAGQIDLQGANTTKDWVYIEDVARAFVAALDSPFVGAINIGTGVEAELRRIGFVISAAFRSEFSWRNSEKPTRMQADWNRARKVLGWSPKVDLMEGLRVILDDAAVREAV